MVAFDVICQGLLLDAHSKPYTDVMLGNNDWNLEAIKDITNTTEKLQRIF